MRLEVGGSHKPAAFVGAGEQPVVERPLAVGAKDATGCRLGRVGGSHAAAVDHSLFVLGLLKCLLRQPTGSLHVMRGEKIVRASDGAAQGVASHEGVL